MTTKRTARKTIDSHRIYVLLPRTVQIPSGSGGERVITRSMEAGRLIAQHGHVITQMRTDPHVLREYGRGLLTTIVLSVRNSRELEKVRGELMAVTPVWDFEDENPPFYGTRRKVRTAICTGPVLREDVDAIIGHLERFKALCE